jgi:hypothetical protein
MIFRVLAPHHLLDFRYELFAGDCHRVAPRFEHAPGLVTLSQFLA